MLYSTSRDFNQSLLDFFNLVDSQLILVLMCESLNLIFSGLYCWAFKLKVIINRTELNWNWEFALLQFQCVACMMCRCTVLLKTKLSSATCLITVKICWNSVVKNLTDSVRWLSTSAEKDCHDGARYHGRHCERRLCAYQMAGCFVPCVGHVWCILLIVLWMKNSLTTTRL